MLPALAFDLLERLRVGLADVLERLLLCLTQLNDGVEILVSLLQVRLHLRELLLHLVELHAEVLPRLACLLELLFLRGSPGMSGQRAASEHARCTYLVCHVISRFCEPCGDLLAQDLLHGREYGVVGLQGLHLFGRVSMVTGHITWSGHATECARGQPFSLQMARARVLTAVRHANER